MPEYLWAHAFFREVGSSWPLEEFILSVAAEEFIGLPWCPASAHTDRDEGSHLNHVYFSRHSLYVRETMVRYKTNHMDLKAMFVYGRKNA